MELALDLSPPESKHFRSWNERLRYVARYKPEEIHVLLERAHAIGVRSVFAVLDPRAEAALREFQTWRDMAVWAVVPNMYAFIRDLTDHGMVGAALSRFLRLRSQMMLAAGLGALRSLVPLAHADFAAGTRWLAQMDLAAIRGLRVSHVFLHPQITEIALAGRVAHLFQEFAREVHQQGMEAGLVTHNPAVAAEVLGSDLQAFGAIIVPYNVKRYKVFGLDSRGFQTSHYGKARLWVSEVTAAGSIRPLEAIAYARRLGAAGALLDYRTVEAMSGSAEDAL